MAKKKKPPLLMWVVGNEVTGDLISAWLKSYDPEANDGYGSFDTTDDRDEAMTFADLEEFHACWTQVPDALPTRPDGKPNRPLTAYTVQARPLATGTGESWRKNRYRGTDGR